MRVAVLKHGALSLPDGSTITAGQTVTERQLGTASFDLLLGSGMGFEEKPKPVRRRQKLETTDGVQNKSRKKKRSDSS